MENISTVILITFAIVFGLMIIGMVIAIIRKLLGQDRRNRTPFTNEIVVSNPF
jgi:hypothetical protein